MVSPAYILGRSTQAEFRLELLNELSTKSFIEALEPLEKKNVKILNLGCGSGHLEEKLAHIFENSHFVCLDLSADRLKEAQKRLGSIQTSNTFEFIQADLTSVPIDSLKPYDILISRFVLTHLPGAVQQFERFLPLVNHNGYVCLEELATGDADLYSNTNTSGYKTFTDMTRSQFHAQGSSSNTGFQLLSRLLSESSIKVLNAHISQAILLDGRQKSILRLGVEEAKAALSKKYPLAEIENAIHHLNQFEKDSNSYGLYSRCLTIIAKVK